MSAGAGVCTLGRAGREGRRGGPGPGALRPEVAQVAPVDDALPHVEYRRDARRLGAPAEAVAEAALRLPPHDGLGGVGVVPEGELPVVAGAREEGVAVWGERRGGPADLRGARGGGGGG